MALIKRGISAGEFFVRVEYVLCGLLGFESGEGIYRLTVSIEGNELFNLSRMLTWKLV